MSRTKDSGDGVVQGLAVATGLVGVISLIGGVIAWLLARSQISDEKIVVPEGPYAGSGRQIKGPLSAYAEAEAIKQIALEATGGRSYGEIDSEDPVAPMAKDASLLRASIFTSVLAFGVAAYQMAYGAVLVAIAFALRRMSARTPVR